MWVENVLQMMVHSQRLPTVIQLSSSINYIQKIIINLTFSNEFRSNSKCSVLEKGKNT